ncbi:PAS domain S-box protein [Chlorogloeopsis sp. ULAP02]|uniref:PAS domain S-box protein n=1 Tax=Chlorogloeopsis sp. ULAP02 TaxID=3107926 RepID=UPI0031370394
MSDLGIPSAREGEVSTNLQPQESLYDHPESCKLRKNILVVDDNPDHLEILIKILSEHGYKVQLVTSGKQALMAVELTQPDLILLDIVMPEMDGFEVCSQLKASAQTKDIPIIFLSVLYKTFDKVKAFSLGGADYITKPFQLEEVLARIENQLRIQRLTKQLNEQTARLVEEIKERKISQEQLKQSEKRYRQFFETSIDGIVITEMAGRIIDCNASYQKMLGYSLEELKLKSFWDLTPIQWHCWEAEIIEQQIIERGYSDTYEKEYIRKDGTLFPVELTVYCQKNDCGQPELMWANVRDISDRKQAQQALHRSLTKNRALVDAIPDMIFRCHVDGTYLEFKSAKGIQPFVPPRAFLGKKIQEILPTKLAHKLLQAQRQAISSQETQILEYQLTIDEQVHDYEARIVACGSHENIIIVRDITERKQTEAALAESEQKYRNLVETSQNIVMSCDRQGRITFVNQAVKQIYDYDPEEMIGRPFTDFLPPELIAKDVEVFQQLLKGTPVYLYETTHLAKDGRSIQLLFNAIALFDEQGQVIGTTGTASDITARKQTEEELQEAYEKLEAYNADLQATNQELQCMLEELQLLEVERQEQYCKLAIEQKRYEDLFNFAPDGYLLTNAKGIIQEANHAFTTSLSVDLKFLVGKPLAIFVPADDLLAFRTKLNKLSLLQEKQTWELRLQPRNGEPFPVEITVAPVRGFSEELIALRWLLRDITERKQAEAALRESEERFRQIAENINQFFFVKSAKDENFLYISPAYEKIWGQSCESLYQNSRAWLEFLHPDDRKLVLLSVEEQSQGKRAQREYRIIKHDGTTRWIFAEVLPILDQLGKPLYYIGLAEDITERKKAEAELKESEQFLRSIYEGIETAVFIVDVLEDGGFRYVGINPANERISGLLSSEVSGKTPEQVLTPEMAQMVSDHYRACIEAGERITYEEYLLIKGKDTWWITNLTPMRDNNNRIYRLIGTSFNITQRKQLEQSLRSQAQQERLLGTITQHIRQSLNLEEILATTVVEVQRTLQADRALIFRLNQDGSGEVIEEAVVPQYPITNQMRWLDECFPEECYEYYRQGNPRIVPDVATDDWGACLAEFMEEVGVKSKMVAPIIQTFDASSNNVWGLLVVHACSHYRQWQASEIDFLQQISNQLAIAIHQANLYHKLQIELAERKQTEAALKAAQENLTIAIEAAQMGTWHLDITKDFAPKRSLRHDQIFGYDTLQPEWGQEIARRHVVEEDREIFDAAFARAMETGELDFEVRIQWLDGSIHWMAARGRFYFDENGKPVYGGGVNFDITDRKQTELALRESEERFRRAFDDAAIGMAMVAIDGSFLRVNRSLCEILGYTESEFLALTFQDITHADDLQKDLDNRQRLLVGETRTYQTQKRYIHKLGHEVWVLLSTSLVRDRDGQSLYFITQYQDISDRQQISRMKNEFISIVSHELRTPLTAIRGSLGILETGILENEPQQVKELIQIALNNSNRLMRLVNDILDLERLESGKVRLVMQECEIADIVKQATETVQSIADEANITLCATFPKIQIWAAPDAIAQALINLLSNAIKFSSAGSSVWLSAELFPDYIMFFVRDNGRGIPSDKLKTIFGRFQQVDASDSRQKGGTGLGLAICKTIIRQHGGQIWAESVLGEGSTFYFTLPTTKREP